MERTVVTHFHDAKSSSPFPGGSNDGDYFLCYLLARNENGSKSRFLYRLLVTMYVPIA